MIGSHDSFTYLPAKSTIMNNITRFWRTQEKTIVEQYQLGVRFFDIRVKREIDENNHIRWRVCHGLAELTKTFTTLKSICVYFSKTLPGCKYRIWMEKGSDEDWEYFKKEAKPLIEEYDGFVQSYRKLDNECLVQKDTYPRMEYLACKMEDIKNIAIGLIDYPIKKWAKEHNPKITQEMIDDPNVIYFMDYVGES